MIRVFAVTSILLIAQAVPAFAKKVTLKCQTSISTRYLTFDLDALTVTIDETQGMNLFIAGVGGTYPIQATDEKVTWQNHSNIDPRIPGRFDPRENWSFTYNRYTAKFATYQAPGPHGDGGTILADCVEAPPAPSLR
jgi:hypothetical protein